MRLNVQSDYALRLLMHLAVRDGELLTIAEVAERFQVSKNHLMKIASLLAREGYIEAARGRSGGLRLAKPAKQVRVGEVVRSTEADFAIVECFQDGKSQCLITPCCKLQRVLGEAVEAFLAVLDRYTLDDLVRRNPDLRLLLGKDAA